jgi:hypothetical protein
LKIGEKSASFELANIDRPIGTWFALNRQICLNTLAFYLDQFIFCRLGYQVRARKKLASFELGNINRPIMFYGIMFFEHGLLSMGNYVQTH